MNNDLLDRLSALGNHLDDERHARSDMTPSLSVIGGDQRSRSEQRRRPAVVAAAAVLVVASLGVLTVLLGQSDAPSESSVNDAPSVAPDEGAEMNASPAESSPGLLIFAPTTGSEPALFEYSVSGRGNGPATIDSVDDSQVCVTVEVGDGTSSGCYDAATVATGLAYGVFGDHGQFVATGVVPDQVDTVTIDSAPVVVVSNVWFVELGSSEPAELRVGDSLSGTFAVLAPATISSGLDNITTTTVSDVRSGRSETVWAEGIPTFDVTIGLAGTSTQIDRGHADGITVGMPVANSKGLVGKITEVTDRTSKVLLATEPNFSVNVELSAFRSSLVATGTGEGELVLRGSTAVTSEDVGAIVYTSGGESTLPRGIPIGTIKSVELRPDAGDGIIATITPITTAEAGSRANVFLYTP